MKTHEKKARSEGVLRVGCLGVRGRVAPLAPAARRIGRALLGQAADAQGLALALVLVRWARRGGRWWCGRARERGGRPPVSAIAIAAIAAAIAIATAAAS